MTLIVDPDNLNQGTLNNVADLAFTSSAGSATTLTGATTLPALADDEFFEIRNAAIPGNNGLYRVNDGTPTTSAIICAKLTGPDPVNDTAESTDILGTTGAGSEKSVHFDTGTKQVFLFEQGNMNVDGVTMLAFHSFAKLEWKSDALLIASSAFPIVGISFAAGQWQIGVDPSGNFSGWKFAEDDGVELFKTRRLVRNAGWDEIDDAGNTLKKFFNVTTLGTFEDVLDLAYYRFGTDATDVAAAVDYEFAGPVNEPVKYFDEVGNPATFTLVDGAGGDDTATRASGSFVDDGFQVGGQMTIRAATTAANNGTFVITGVAALTLTFATGSWDTGEVDPLAQVAVDNDNVFQTFIRIRDADPEGKSFQQANLNSGGETEIASKIIKFPLANATDLDIVETDANVGTILPYTEIRIRYLAGVYNREVDTAAKRLFGIVIDVGTYSRENGVSATSTLFVSANHTLGVGEALADYAGGTLIIHEGTDQGSHTISGTPVDNAGTLEITLTGALTDTESPLSFTMERATPITATKTEIYEKVHYQLRQDSDIDETDQVVSGKTADDLLQFIGADIKAGSFTPSNPNGGGSGVIVEGFDANDTNNWFFFDNGQVQRNFPFVAAGNLVFNQGLVDDTDGEFWLFFAYTDRTTNADIDTVAPAGDSYTLTGTLPNMAVNDYIEISGFVQAENNGLFIVEVENTPSVSYDIRKVDGSAVGTAETDQTVNVDENPYPSPDAILVDDNGGADVIGGIGSTSVAFDFDYDGNVQGGRTQGTPADVVLVAAGLETSQVAVVKALVITRTVGLTFSVTSAQERNYSNP